MVLGTAYTNGKIFNGHYLEAGKAILVDNNMIVDIIPDNDIPENYQRVDLEGKYISPAFIDLQIYGGNGHLFSHELSIEALHATYDYCVEGGCAHFMITMATNAIEKFVQAFDVVRNYWEDGGKGLLGLHLEGPYINKLKRGAHLEDCVKTPTLEEVQMLLEKGEHVFKMMTLAPEECDEAIIELLLQHNIIVSAGHTNATYQQARAAFNKGIPAATHLFNAMSPLQHREPGMVGAIFNHPAVMSSIVCDGIHVHFDAVRIAKTQMQERLFFITDAVAETLSGEYQHLFKGDRYALPDGTLSGSALTMMQCIKNGVTKVGIDLEESLRMATLYPAQVLNNPRLGTLEKGNQFNVVIFDEELKVQQVHC